jgi:hypothetical protein
VTTIVGWKDIFCRQTSLFWSVGDMAQSVKNAFYRRMIRLYPNWAIYLSIYRKVDCSVENLTCVVKSSGFWISHRIFSVCCESCLISVGATPATTRNETCLDICFKKDLQSANAYIFLLFTKSLKKSHKNEEFLNCFGGLIRAVDKLPRSYPSMPPCRYLSPTYNNDEDFEFWRVWWLHTRGRWCSKTAKINLKLRITRIITCFDHKMVSVSIFNNN